MDPDPESPIIYGSGSIRNTACEIFLTAMAVNNVFCQVTVKEATVNTIVAAEVAGWFFIGKNKGVTSRNCVTSCQRLSLAEKRD